MYFLIPLGVSGLTLSDIDPHLYQGDDEIEEISPPFTVTLTEDPVTSGTYRIDNLPDSTPTTIRYTYTVEYPEGTGHSFIWGGEDNGSPVKVIIPVREAGLTVDDFTFTIYKNGVGQEDVVFQVDEPLQSDGDYPISGWPIESSSNHWMLVWSRVDSGISNFYTWQESSPLVIPSSLGGLFPAPILRLGIKIADSLTKGVQPFVVLEQWISQTVHGDDEYGPPIPIQCVIDRTNKLMAIGSEQVTIGATLTIIGDVQPNGAVGRREPIDPRDRITLPDGFTGPVISSPNAVMDPGTNRGFIHEVMLGVR